MFVDAENKSNVVPFVYIGRRELVFGLQNCQGRNAIRIAIDRPYKLGCFLYNAPWCKKCSRLVSISSNSVLVLDKRSAISLLVLGFKTINPLGILNDGKFNA